VQQHNRDVAVLISVRLLVATLIAYEAYSFVTYMATGHVPFANYSLKFEFGIRAEGKFVASSTFGGFFDPL
jgi:hypothetical protein